MLPAPINKVFAAGVRVQLAMRSPLAIAVMAIAFAGVYYLGLWADFGLPVGTGLFSASLPKQPYDAFLVGCGCGFLAFFPLPAVTAPWCIISRG